MNKRRKQIKKFFFLHFFQSHKITLWQITPIKVILSSDYHSRKSLWRLGWSPSRVMCGDHPVGLRDFWWSVTIPESLKQAKLNSFLAFSTSPDMETTTILSLEPGLYYGACLAIPYDNPAGFLNKNNLLLNAKRLFSDTIMTTWSICQTSIFNFCHVFTSFEIYP